MPDFRHWVRAMTLAFALLLLNGCGGGCDACRPGTYAVGGTISGLVGSGLVLSNNGKNVSIAPAYNGRLSDLFINVPDGTSYDVTVTTQPTAPSQTCVIANGQGTIAAANVSDLSITCTTTPARFLFGQGVTGNGTPCIEASTLDATTGALAATSASPLCPGTNEPFVQLNGQMVVEAQGKFLYIAAPGGQIGDLGTFSIDHDSGALTYVREQGVVELEDLAVDPSGRFLFAISSGLGNENGGIGAATIDPASGALAFASGGGYSFPNGTEGGTVSVDPLSRFVYVLFGTANSSESSVVTLSIDSTTAALSQIASPIAVNTGSLWMVPHPSGKFLYVGTNVSSIVAFNVDPTNGTLTPVAGSPFAANNDAGLVAVVDPSGNYLYVVNGVSNNISAYTINQSNGQLTPISGSPFPTRQAPATVAIEPLGHFLYVSSDAFTAGTPGVSAYEIGPTGALTEINGSPFTGAFGSHAVISY